MPPKWLLDPNKALLVRQVAYTASLPNTIADKLEVIDGKIDAQDLVLVDIKAKTDTIT